MLLEIATELYERVLPLFWSWEKPVFLAGGPPGRPEFLRDSLRNALTGWQYGEAYDFYYPEEIFEDILWRRSRDDLLTVENFLARIVHAVVLVIEGPGAICELGAFANHPQLRTKLIAIVDDKYRHKSSFIMRGPIDSLRRENRGHVVYYTSTDIREPSAELIGRVRTGLRSIKSAEKVKREISNPITAQLLALAVAFCIDGVRENDIAAIFAHVSRNRLAAYESHLLAETALGALRLRGELMFDRTGCTPTPEGVARLRRATYWVKRVRRRVAMDFDRLRVRSLVEMRSR